MTGMIELGIIASQKHETCLFFKDRRKKRCSDLTLICMKQLILLCKSNDCFEIWVDVEQPLLNLLW